MSAPSSPPWTRADPRRRGHGNPDLRVSDADRAQVADRLSKHYSDGRLDQAEFNQRLDQAMSAKNQSDLAGLFADLPGTESRPGTESAEAAARQADRHLRRHRILSLVLVAVVTAALGQALVRSYIPWLLIGVLAVFLLRYGPRHHRRG